MSTSSSHLSTSLLASSRYFSFSLTIALNLLFILGGSSIAFAKTTVSPHGNSLFSTQQRVGFHSGDDWEPSLTTDNFGHVYVLYKHYDVKGGQTCPHCAMHMLFQRSDDEGQTWTAPRPVAPMTSGQDDPQIAVDPVDGKTIWASFMVNFPHAYIAVVKSTDFGETWTAPRTVSPQPPNFDKDALVVRGNTIAVAYDGVNTWVSISLDGGEHWAVHPIFPGSNQFYQSLSAGGGIDSHGNLFFSWNSFDKAHNKTGNGPVKLWVSKSTDQGVHWTRTVFDVSGAPPPCHPCGFAYLSAQDAMKIGSDDTIYLLWNGTVDLTNFAPERIFFARSTDDGQTYSTRVDVSNARNGVEHSFPALAVGTHPGDVRIGWMDKRTGAWNLFFRRSFDGGEHFSPIVRVSSFVPGYSYITPNGFNLPYGDYFSMGVDEDNNTQMAFGEGPNYTGPGNIWVSHSLAE